MRVDILQTISGFNVKSGSAASVLATKTLTHHSSQSAGDFWAVTTGLTSSSKSSRCEGFASSSVLRFADFLLSILFSPHRTAFYHPHLGCAAAVVIVYIVSVSLSDSKPLFIRRHLVLAVLDRLGGTVSSSK